MTVGRTGCGTPRGLFFYLKIDRGDVSEKPVEVHKRHIMEAQPQDQGRSGFVRHETP